MDRSILYIVGFMGAGKSSVGGRLAELLHRRFVDLDREIEARAGESIRELFRRDGEPSFRRLDTVELRRVSTEKELVVALGGGAFCSRENQDIVRSTGASIWLDAPLEVLFSRCEGDGSRPLFTGSEEMKDLFERRRSFYEKADLHVKTTDMDVDHIVTKILELLAPE